jgi:hypothetical protein
MRKLSDLAHLHTKFAELFLQHQRALIWGDVASAQARLDEYERDLLDHMRDEEELLIPIYAGRAEPPIGGAAEIFLNEHLKIREYLKLFQAEIPKVAAAKDREQAVLWLLDSQCTFKRLLVHHDNRERKFLYPFLDQITTAQEKERLFEELRLPPVELATASLTAA